MTLSYVGKLWMLPQESVFPLFGTMMTRVPSKKKKKSRVVHDGEGSQQFVCATDDFTLTIRYHF